MAYNRASKVVDKIPEWSQSLPLLFCKASAYHVDDGVLACSKVRSATHGGTTATVLTRHPHVWHVERRPDFIGNSLFAFLRTVKEDAQEGRPLRGREDAIRPASQIVRGVAMVCMLLLGAEEVEVCQHNRVIFSQCSDHRNYKGMARFH